MLTSGGSSKIIYTLTAGGSITKGQLVYMSGADTVLAVASNTNFYRALGVALDTASSGAIRVQVAIVGAKCNAFTGLTAGNRYGYNSSGVLTATAGFTPGSYYDIGVAINATTIVFTQTQKYPSFKTSLLSSNGTFTYNGQGIIHNIKSRLASLTGTVTIVVDGTTILNQTINNTTNQFAQYSLATGVDLDFSLNSPNGNDLNICFRDSFSITHSGNTGLNTQTYYSTY